jgi:hypothetical protein
VLGLARKTILILALASFISMATGTAIFLHIISTNHHEYHNHNKCPLCFQLLLTTPKTIIQPSIKIQNFELFLYYIQIYTQIEKTIIKFQLPLLRAPPVLSNYNF